MRLSSGMSTRVPYLSALSSVRGLLSLPLCQVRVRMSFVQIQYRKKVRLKVLGLPCSPSSLPCGLSWVTHVSQRYGTKEAKRPSSYREPPRQLGRTFQHGCSTPSLEITPPGPWARSMLCNCPPYFTPSLNGFPCLIRYGCDCYRNSLMLHLHGK